MSDFINDNYRYAFKLIKPLRTLNCKSIIIDDYKYHINRGDATTKIIDYNLLIETEKYFFLRKLSIIIIIFFSENLKIFF